MKTKLSLFLTVCFFICFNFFCSEQFVMSKYPDTDIYFHRPKDIKQKNCAKLLRIRCYSHQDPKDRIIFINASEICFKAMLMFGTDIKVLIKEESHYVELDTQCFYSDFVSKALYVTRIKNKSTN